MNAPLYDLDAEECVVGALLLSRSAIDVVRSVVTPSDFGRPSLGIIFDAVLRLRERGEPADAVTVADELRRLGALDEAGGPAALVSLQANTPATSSAGRYAEIVARFALRRRLAGEGAELADAARDLTKDPTGTLEAHRSRVAEIEERARSRSGLELRWAQDAVDDPPAEPPVLIDGFLRAGELAVLGAPRGIGKSWLAMNLAVLLGRGDGFLAGALPVRRRTRVLIAQGEVDPWESSRRWRMLTGEEGAPDGVAETFEHWRLRTVKRRSATEEWVTASLDGRLEATVVEHGFEVLVIDPWRVYFAGGENSNDEVEAALAELRALSLRTGLAVVILHHLGKSTEAREPEDLWRGASRLADWASTRVTLLPHFTDRQAEAQGMTRQQARRYVDAKFLRRSTPTPDFSMLLDPETGWWSRWKAPAEAADARRTHLDVPDVVEALRASGGSWPSKKRAADALDLSQETAARLLAAAVRVGAIEAMPGERGATAYRLPGAHLEPVEAPDR